MIAMKLLSLAFFTIISTQAFALPVGSFDALKVASNKLNALDPNYDFDGIVKLSNCSGSIIRMYI